MSTTDALPILHLSVITGGDLRDTAGGKLGRVEDVIVRLGDEYPLVSGLLARVASRPVFVPGGAIHEIGHDGVELGQATLDLRPLSATSPARPVAPTPADRQVRASR